MSSLFDFEDVEPPRITETKPVFHPDRRDVILGFAARCKNRDNAPCINVQRYRHGGGVEKQDYYRKVGGYSMTKATIDRLQKAGAEYLFIEEMDNDRLIEYQVAQYPDAESVEDHKGEPQWCCPVDDALHTWSLSETTINHAGQR